MYEYSYFCARGLSLQAVERLEDAKAQIKEISERLAKRFGADEFHCWPAREGEAATPMFIFKDRFKVPAFFEIFQANQTSDFIERDVFTRPKSGTPEEYQIRSALGLIEHYRKQQRLEDIFGCGEMPEKNLEAGGYSGAFVKSHSVMTPITTSSGKSFGLIPDHVTCAFGANAGITIENPLDFMKLADDWYIRVPNDAAGQPLFTPPDAEPVSFIRMLDIDKAEFDRRRPFTNVHIPGF